MKPERDPVTCEVCDDEATVSTPEGGMCEAHAEERARYYDWWDGEEGST